MAEKQQRDRVRFIRKGGRVIPIRAKKHGSWQAKRYREIKKRRKESSQQAGLYSALAIGAGLSGSLYASKISGKIAKREAYLLKRMRWGFEKSNFQRDILRDSVSSRRSARKALRLSESIHKLGKKRRLALRASSLGSAFFAGVAGERFAKRYVSDTEFGDMVQRTSGAAAAGSVYLLSAAIHKKYEKGIPISRTMKVGMKRSSRLAGRSLKKGFAKYAPQVRKAVSKAAYEGFKRVLKRKAKL